MIEIAAVTLVFITFSLLSRRLANTLISAPMFFLFAGLLLASNWVRLVSFKDAEPALLIIGVMALALKFF